MTSGPTKKFLEKSLLNGYWTYSKIVPMASMRTSISGKLVAAENMSDWILYET